MIKTIIPRLQRLEKLKSSKSTTHILYWGLYKELVNKSKILVCALDFLVIKADNMRIEFVMHIYGR